MEMIFPYGPLLKSSHPKLLKCVCGRGASRKSGYDKGNVLAVGGDKRESGIWCIIT